MSLQTDVLLGVQTPQILHLPGDVHSLEEATGAIEWADAYGMHLDDSQQITLSAWMGTRRNGTWASSQNADAESRQNGKGDTIQAREGYGMTVLHEPIIHTAHEVPTAVQAFLRMVSLFESYDDLRRLVKRIRYANGEQGIELLSGAAIYYKARTGSGARGFDDIGTLVYDEAQHCRPEHLAASSPTMAVHPNPQAIFAGSAGLDFSDVWWSIRKRGIVGHQRRLAGLDNIDPRFAYAEHTAELVTIDDDGKLHSVKPEAADRRTWAIANPAYNVRIPDDFLASQLRLLGEALFLREHGGVWDALPGDDGHLRVVTVEQWAAAGVADGVEIGARALAWEVSPDRSWSSVGWVGRRTDGTFHGEIIESKAGTDWVPERLARYATGAGSLVVAVGVDPGAPAGALLPDVEAAFRTAGLRLEAGDKGNLVKVSGQSDAAACGDWFDKVTTGQFRHINQGWLNNAVDNASWVTVGKSRVIDRKNVKADITPLCLVVVALRALQMAPEQVDDTGGFTDLNDFDDDDDDDWD